MREKTNVRLSIIGIGALSHPNSGRTGEPQEA